MPRFACCLMVDVFGGMWSHRQFQHSSKPGTVTIAGKPGTDVQAGTLNGVLKQAGLKK